MQAAISTATTNSGTCGEKPVLKVMYPFPIVGSVKVGDSVNITLKSTFTPDTYVTCIILSVFFFFFFVCVKLFFDITYIPLCMALKQIS